MNQLSLKETMNSTDQKSFDGQQPSLMDLAFVLLFVALANRYLHSESFSRALYWIRNSSSYRGNYLKLRVRFDPLLVLCPEVPQLSHMDIESIRTYEILFEVRVVYHSWDHLKWFAAKCLAYRLKLPKWSFSKGVQCKAILVGGTVQKLDFNTTILKTENLHLIDHIVLEPGPDVPKIRKAPKDIDYIIADSHVPFSCFSWLVKARSKLAF